MNRNLILSGGIAHDFEATSQALADVLDEVGITSTITEDVDAINSHAEFDLVSINCVRWTCSQEQVGSAWRDEWAFELSKSARAAFRAYLETGKGIVAFHAATICFDDWPEFANAILQCVRCPAPPAVPPAFREKYEWSAIMQRIRFDDS